MNYFFVSFRLHSRVDFYIDVLLCVNTGEANKMKILRM